MPNDNLAYALKNFDVDTQLQDAKLPRIQQLPKTQTVPKQKSAWKLLLTLAYIVALCSTLIYGKVKLTEENAYLLDLKEQKQEVDSEQVRLDLKLQGMMSLKNVEDTAKNELGLCEANQNQIEYIAVSDGNKMEVIRDTTDIADEIVKIYNQIKEYIVG